MQHKGSGLVAGKTRSGKGQFVRGLVKACRANGAKAIHYTPKQIEHDGVKHLYNFATMDAQEFYDRLKLEAHKREGAIIAVVDEAMTFQQSNPSEFAEILNQFAAYGVEVWLQVQRAKMVPPNIREAVENCVCFTQTHPDSAKVLAEMFHVDFMDVVNLPKGEFIAKFGMGAVQRGRSWNLIEGVFEGVETLI